MDKSTVEKFQNENRAVWFLGPRTAMPLKGRIVKICGDDSTREYAKIDYIYDDSVVFGSDKVRLDYLYESKDDIVAATCKAVLDKTAEIKAAIQTKDDCIRFMFSHAVADTAECTDWVARRAIQKIAKKRWNLDLK